MTKEGSRSRLRPRRLPSLVDTWLLMADATVDIFIPGRTPEDVLALMARLAAIGVGGRDAAYLASVVPPEDESTPEMTRFLSDFEFMVHPSARRGAAALIGLPSRY